MGADTALAGESLFSLSATPVTSVVSAGEPVKLRVVTKNLSQQTLNFWVENATDQAGWAYEISVHDADGNTAPVTSLGLYFRYVREGSPNASVTLAGSRGYISLKPGESVENIVDPSILYDFGKPGKYLIDVRRSAAGYDAALVQSNTVTVTIVQPASSDRVSRLRSGSIEGRPVSL